MKERPILFSGPMVRAIDDDRKTQTRRMVKPQPHYDLRQSPALGDWVESGGVASWSCPYGTAGDQLWVRETWQHFDQAPRDTAYLADIEAIEDKDTRADLLAVLNGRWKPSIHMHRKRSRFDLEVLSVRVERLQAISEEDAWAEGCKRGLATDNGGFFPAEEPDPSGKGFRGWDSAREWYQDLWEEINGPGSWEANPWVWVVEFKKVTATA